jgi:hypothetical protein
LRRLFSASPSRTYTTLPARRLCAMRNTFAAFSPIPTSPLVEAVGN